MSFQSQEKILGIENSIKKYFPQKWTKSDTLVFIEDSEFQFDLDTLNNGLNIPIRDFVLRGGKRIRPLLFLTCLDLFGLDYTKYFDFSVLLELIHNGTLVLDDIEDNGMLRRGLPTLHVKYGVDIATNVGAGLHFLPMKIFMKSTKNLSVEKQLKIWEDINQELVNVSFGQSLDIYWHTQKSPLDISVNKYLEMVSLKTGSLMRMSVVMACVIADKSDVVTKLFKDFAQNLGIAFQIIDDCLDLDSDLNKFGKSYGNDISEGKLSLPIIYCLQKINNEDRTILLGILKKHTRNKKLISKAIGMIKESGSISKSRRFAANFIE